MFGRCRVRLPLGIPTIPTKVFADFFSTSEKFLEINFVSNYILLILPFDVTGLYAELLIGHIRRNNLS